MEKECKEKALAVSAAYSMIQGIFMFVCQTITKWPKCNHPLDGVFQKA